MMQLSSMSSVDVVNAFCASVVRTHGFKHLGELVSDNFCLQSRGNRHMTLKDLQRRASSYFERIQELRIETVDSFENEDGSRVVSSLRINFVYLSGSEGHFKPTRVAVGGTSVWAVDEDKKLKHIWIETAIWGIWHRVLSPPESGKSSQVNPSTRKLGTNNVN
jgi:hypothetical protein